MADAIVVKFTILPLYNDNEDFNNIFLAVYPPWKAGGPQTGPRCNFNSYNRLHSHKIFHCPFFDEE